MISEVDIRDWPEEVREGYDQFMYRNAHRHPNTLEVWEAATHWAFSNLWEKNVKVKSLWRKRQIEEEAND